MASITIPGDRDDDSKPTSCGKDSALLLSAAASIVFAVVALVLFFI